MKITIALLVLAAAVATSLEPPCKDCPSEDSIVPEVALVDETFSLMQAYATKTGADACRKTASASMTGVSNAAKELQRVLDAFKNAAACPKKGQSAVEQTGREVRDARQHQKKSASAYSTAKTTTVSFGPFAYDTLKVGQCNNFFNSRSYRKVDAVVKSKKSTLAKANTRSTDADKALSTAQKNAKVLRNKCYCTAKYNYKQLFDKLSKQLVKDQSKPWRRAHLLLCVLKGTSEGNCKIAPLPKLRKKSLGRNADAAVCSPGYRGQSNKGWGSPYTTTNGDSNCQAKYGASAHWCSKKEIFNIPSQMPQGTYLPVRDRYSSGQHFKSNSLALCSQASSNRWSISWDYRCNGQQNPCCT